MNLQQSETSAQQIPRQQDLARNGQERSPMLTANAHGRKVEVGCLSQAENQPLGSVNVGELNEARFLADRIEME